MGEECFNASKRRKIEDTVLQILKASDLETITEFGVRSAAAVRLGFELSGLNNRLLVRQLVDSFLLSTAAGILRSNSVIRINDGNSTDKNADYHVEQRRQQQQSGNDAVSEANYDGKIICKVRYIFEKYMIKQPDATKILRLLTSYLWGYFSFKTFRRLCH